MTSYNQLLINIIDDHWLHINELLRRTQIEIIKIENDTVVTFKFTKFYNKYYLSSYLGNYYMLRQSFLYDKL